MEGKNRHRYAREQRRIEESWDDEPEVLSSATLAFEEDYTDEVPISTRHMAAKESAAREEYSQWQRECTLTQGGSGPFNMPCPWSIPPYAAQPAATWTHSPFQPPRAQFTGQYQSAYFATQGIRARAPAYQPAALNPVPSPQPGNVHPILPQLHPPRRPRHDFWFNEFGIPAEDLVYRRGKFEYDTSADFELTKMRPVVWKNSTRRICPPSQTHRPPQNNMDTIAGRYSRYSAKSSVLHQPAPKLPTHRTATKKDARFHRIPTYFIREQWDPDENPIIFCENIFDTNSLGKWIFDWTAWSYGGKDSPMAKIAGDLWLLLIDLGGKLKLSDGFLRKFTQRTSQELDEADMVRDFIATGERLMEKLQLFLRKCERPVWEALDEETELGGLLVDIMFDRENQLGQTERIIQSIRLWNFRWDVNCADVVRKNTTVSRS